MELYKSAKEKAKIARLDILKKMEKAINPKTKRTGQKTVEYGYRRNEPKIRNSLCNFKS